MPHHYAAEKRRLLALAALLKDKRTPLKEGVHDGQTALHLAASEDKHEVIEVLLAHAVNVDKRSYTVSHQAALPTFIKLWSQGHIDIIGCPKAVLVCLAGQA